MDWLSPAAMIMFGTVLIAAGMWLLLPRGNSAGKSIGAIITILGGGMLAYQVPRLADWGSTGTWWDDLSNIVFMSLAGLTIVAAVCSVTFRNPVYCAIWFAVTLLAAAGVLLYQGAQFLGVATVVVYAGAILVTFLFVLMLAQPQGHAFYDRISWEGLLSATVGAVMIGILVSIISGLSQNPVAPRGEVSAATSNDPVGEMVFLQPSDGAVSEVVVPDRTRKVLASEHMAGLGGELFGKHLIAIEAAGALLFVALVGAVAIVAHEKHGAGGSHKSRSAAEGKA